MKTNPLNPEGIIMDANTSTTSADLVVLDDVTAPDDSDDEGTSNAAIGAICIAAGVAIGTFIVPPVVGYVRSWFTSTSDVPAQVAEIMAPTDETPVEKAV